VAIPQEYLGPDGRVDVSRVMESIRRGLQAEGAEVRARRLLVSAAEEAEVDPELVARLFSPGGGWNLLPDYTIETHRSGLEGALVVAVKQLCRVFVRPYTDTLVRQQGAINRALLATCLALAERVVRLEDSQGAARKDP
jgi:hypothetical protein